MDDLSLIKYAATLGATIASLPTIKHYFPNFCERLTAPLSPDETSTLVIDFHAALDKIRPKIPDIGLQKLTDPEVLRGQSVQSYCTDLLEADELTKLLARVDFAHHENHKIWIKSLDCREAGKWLTTRHTSGKFSLTSDQFQAALCYRMYMAQPRLMPHKRCSCRTATAHDVRGHHLTTGCPIGGWRIKTHDDLRNEMCALFRAYGIAYVKEELLCFALGSKKRADISILAGQMDLVNKLLLDVSVTATIVQAIEGHVNVNNPGAAAHVRYEYKRGKYEAEANQNNHKFFANSLRIHWSDASRIFEVPEESRCGRCSG